MTGGRSFALLLHALVFLTSRASGFAQEESHHQRQHDGRVPDDVGLAEIGQRQRRAAGDPHYRAIHRGSGDGKSVEKQNLRRIPSERKNHRSAAYAGDDHKRQSLAANRQRA